MGLVAAAQLAGHLSVVKRVNVPHCSPVKKWAGNPAVLTSPSDLRQRWKPFGSGSPGLPSDLSTTPEKVGQRKLSFSPVKVCHGYFYENVCTRM